MSVDVTKLIDADLLDEYHEGVVEELDNIKRICGIEIASDLKAVGSTSVTFNNAAISSASQLTLYSDNATDTPIFWTAVSVSSGSVTYTIPALTVATTFYLQIINNFQTAFPVVQQSGE